MNKKSVNFSEGLRVLKKENEVIRRPEPVAQEIPSARQGSRVGKVSMTLWVDPAVRKQIAQLSLDHDGKTQEALVKEGVNLMFEKYGKPPIASILVDFFYFSCRKRAIVSGEWISSLN